MEAWRQYRAFGVTLPGPARNGGKVRVEVDGNGQAGRMSESRASSQDTIVEGEGAGASHGAGEVVTPDDERWGATNRAQPSTSRPIVVGEKPLHPRPRPQPDPSLTAPAPAPIYVTFEPGDPADPQNWSTAYKTAVLAMLTFLTFGLTFASSISSATQNALVDESGCSEVAAVATTGVFLVGMGLGAMPAAPMSELYGRLPVYAITVLIATLFEIGCALAPTIPALIVLRFFAGFFSAAPLSNAGGSLNDIGNPIVRSITLPMFATVGFVGPVVGPLVGGFVVQDERLGWRWCYWITAIINAASFIVVLVWMPETLGPALLKYKAVMWRKKTGDARWKAKVEDESLKAATIRSLERPFNMLGVEPIVQFFVLYLTIAYIVLFGSFTAYPYIFGPHGLSDAEVGLTFIPILVGFAILLGLMVLAWRRYAGLVHDANEGIERRGIYEGKVEPEERLVPLMFCGILFPAGLFWLAWTSDFRYSIWLTMMSGIPLGVGILCIFQGSYQYMIDAYGPYAASALAGATLVRYFVSGLVLLAFPQMYATLGNEWATSLLAFLACLLTPGSFLFYMYGRRVRQRCQYTVHDE